MNTTLETTDPAIAAIDGLLSILHARRESGDDSPKLAHAIDGALDERLRLINLASPAALPVARRSARPIIALDGTLLVESKEPLTEDAATLLSFLSAGDILAGSLRLEDIERRYQSWWRTAVAPAGHQWKAEVVDQACSYYFKAIVHEISTGRLTILRETGICYEVRLARVSNAWSSATSFVFEPIA